MALISLDLNGSLIDRLFADNTNGIRIPFVSLGHLASIPQMHPLTTPARYGKIAKNSNK
jgi:hypothetical protein